jgi:hypothetical protein
MSKRTWLFRILVLAALGLMVLSWLMPWWAADVEAISEDAVIIHPWGLEQHLGEMADMIRNAKMPVWFAPVMWSYLGLALTALLVGLFIKEKAFNLGKFRLSVPSLLIGIVGFSYVVVVVMAVIVAAVRTGDFWDLKLIGYTYINLGEPAVTGVTANLLLGYWLACSVGPALIALAVLRNRITGKSQVGL